VAWHQACNRVPTRRDVFAQLLRPSEAEQTKIHHRNMLRAGQHLAWNRAPRQTGRCRCRLVCSVRLTENPSPTLSTGFIAFTLLETLLRTDSATTTHPNPSIEKVSSSA
jgi:hypothetical protein